MAEPEIVPSIEICNLSESRDIRPKMVDGLGVEYLLDSGSMACVIPAGPKDRVDPNISLKSVDGKRFDCFGRKEIEIKINRKTYRITAMIAKVKRAILGWDFFRKYRLDLIWNEFGDLFLHDKKAKIEVSQFSWDQIIGYC